MFFLLAAGPGEWNELFVLYDRAAPPASFKVHGPLAPVQPNKVQNTTNCGPLYGQ